MYDGFTIKPNTYDFKRRVDNFLGHAFVEFFRNPGADALYQIHDYLKDVFEPYVPIDTGELVDSVEVSSDGITYNTPYAHYVYEGEVYGPNFLVKDKETGELVWRSPKGKTKFPTGRMMNYQNPLATRHWDETALTDNWDTVEERIRDIIIEAWNNEH